MPPWPSTTSGVEATVDGPAAWLHWQKCTIFDDCLKWHFSIFWRNVSFDRLYFWTYLGFSRRKNFNKNIGYWNSGLHPYYVDAAEITTAGNKSVLLCKPSISHNFIINSDRWKRPLGKTLHEKQITTLSCFVADLALKWTSPTACVWWRWWRLQKLFLT